MSDKLQKIYDTTGAPIEYVPRPRSTTYNPTFSREMYQKRSYDGVTGFEIEYPKPPSRALLLLEGLKFPIGFFDL